MNSTVFVGSQACAALAAKIAESAVTPATATPDRRDSWNLRFISGFLPDSRPVFRIGREPRSPRVLLFCWPEDTSQRHAAYCISARGANALSYVRGMRKAASQPESLAN